VRPTVVPARTLSPQAEGSHLVLPRIGLRLPRQLPFEAWLGLGRQLSALAASSAWCLGDWLVFGQQAYAWRYREAMEQTGLEHQTLRNYAWVARRFELSRRRDTLSFGHHAEVASLPAPEQDFWLRKAEEFSWSTTQLRGEVRASLHERQQAKAEIEPDRYEETRPHQPAGQQVTVRIKLRPEQAQLWQQAATGQGLTVPAWAAQILDHAARNAPSTGHLQMCRKVS
jgi:hypothetical protein